MELMNLDVRDMQFWLHEAERKNAEDQLKAIQAISCGMGGKHAASVIAKLNNSLRIHGKKETDWDRIAESRRRFYAANGVEWDGKS